MSWIALDDLIRIIHFALENENLKGAINATAPNPVINEEFTKALGKVLYRPTFIPIPSFAIKLIFGEKGETLLLEGTRALPKKLEDAGFEFKFPKLEDALKRALE
jgi:NAD dependent epimerase/dehydratase family enzyme